MTWRPVTMGEARLVVPPGAIVHRIEQPPDSLQDMVLVRSELHPGIPSVVILTSRPWEDGWHLASVVERFSANCTPGSVAVSTIDVPGAAVARRLDGIIELEEGFGGQDALESMTILLARSAADRLVTVTIRMALGEREEAGGGVDQVVASFALDAAD